MTRVFTTLILLYRVQTSAVTDTDTADVIS